MKRALILLLAALLLLTGCNRKKDAGLSQLPAAAPELQPGSAYTLAAYGIGGSPTITEHVCLSGNNLFFLASTETTGLYRCSLTDGSTTAVAELSTLQQTEEAFSAAADLFAGKEGSVWVMENTTHYIFDLPKNFDPDTQNQWEYYQYRGDSTVMRQYSADGDSLRSFALTNLQSALQSAICAGDYILCAQGQTLLVLTQDGSTVATVSVPAWISAMTPSDTGALIFTGHEGDTGGTVYTLNLSDFTLSEGSALPVCIYTPCGLSGQTLYFTDRGNLFSWDLATGSGKKLLDWQEYDRNRAHIASLLVTPSGTLAALSQTDAGAAAEFLVLTPATATVNPTALHLGVLYPDETTMTLVLRYNKENPDSRVRVLDYSEYEVLGQNGAAKLRQDLDSGAAIDLLFSADWYTPITLLAPEHLADLSAYLQKDETLQKQGLMDNVMSLLREPDGRLLQISPRFQLSTAMGRADILGSEALTVTRAAQLSGTVSGDGISSAEPYTTAAYALQAHLSRQAQQYFRADACYLMQDAFRQGLDFARLYPAAIDWDLYNQKGIPEGWIRVRNGNQLFLSGNYNSFAALAHDMSSIGENAVLCGWPDLGGSHAVEIWESWGMTVNCRTPELGWKFLRQILLEENQISLFRSGLPTNRSAFQRAGRNAMQSGTTDYYTANGSSVAVSSTLTESQLEAITNAVNTASVLTMPVPTDVAEAVSAAAADYFTGSMAQDDAMAAVQLAATGALHPELIQ